MTSPKPDVFSEVEQPIKLTDKCYVMLSAIAALEADSWYINDHERVCGTAITLKNGKILRVAIRLAEAILALEGGE